MTQMLILDPAVPTTTAVEYARFSPVASNDAGRLPRVAPAFIRADEAYYWSFHWQKDVQASMSALSEGEYEEFDSEDPNDVVRWMLHMDDDC
jgi:hypothetical protein